MAHFRFYEKGAPFPGNCVFSGERTNLWEIGNMTVQGQPITVLISDRVLVELATQAGFVTSKTYAETTSVLSEKNKTLAAQVDATPELLRKFQHDISNLIGDFVTGLASVTSTNNAIQPESDQAESRSDHPSVRAKREGGEGKKQASKPSSESAE